jgi:broad specificity phosphatase PhoE
MRILAIRHGVTPWNREKRWQGVTDIPLCTEGEEQAISAANYLVRSNWSGREIYCSNLERSLRTAQLISQRVGLGPPRILNELTERDLGDWDGRTVEEIDKAQPGVIGLWMTGALSGPPLGETDATAADRFTQGCLTIAQCAENDTSPSLAITHAGVIHAFDRRSSIPFTDYGPLAGRWIDVRDGLVTPGEQCSLLP